MKHSQRLPQRLAGISLAILLSTVFAVGQAAESKASKVDTQSTVSIDEPGRVPYQTAAFGRCEGTVCIASFNAVPAGHRLVIQHVSGNLSTLDPVADGTRVLISISNKAQFTSFPVTPFIPGVFVGGFDQPVQFYVDGGQIPTLQVNIGVSQLNIFNPTIIGYELDCAIASCAPIAGAN